MNERKQIPLFEDYYIDKNATIYYKQEPLQIFYGLQDGIGRVELWADDECVIKTVWGLYVETWGKSTLIDNIIREETNFDPEEHRKHRQVDTAKLFNVSLGTINAFLKKEKKDDKRGSTPDGSGNEHDH